MKKADSVLLLLALLPACSFAETVAGGELEPQRLEGTMAFVQGVAASAAKDYFHREPNLDAANHVIEVRNSNFWAGDTQVRITLTEIGPNLIEVGVASQGRGFNQPLWNRSRRDVERYLQVLKGAYARAIATSRGDRPKKSTAERLQDLDTLRKDGLISASEYDRARARILRDL